MSSRISDDQRSARHFICTICSREFKRSDTLRRHLHVHNRDNQLRKSRRTSCTACVRSKKRCSKQRPYCQTCNRNSLNCVYEDGKERAGSEVKNGPSVATPDGIRATRSSLLTTEFPRLSTEVGMEESFPQFESPLEVADINPVLWNEGLDWDWLLECGEDMGISTPLGILPNYEMPYGRHALDPISETTQPGFRSGGVLPLTDGQAIPASSLLPTPDPQDTCEPNDPWPLEWRAEGQQALNLPKLDDKIGDTVTTYYGMKSLGDGFRNKLQEAIQLPLEHPPWRIVSLANFPNKAQLDRCIDLFFAHHNSDFGLLHRPTFQPDREPVVIILAIASIGACYSNMENSRTFSNVLSELNRRLLWYMGESDPRFLRSTFYITAQLLQNRYGYCSGSKRMFDLSESSRSTLINNAVSIGIFQETLSSDQEDMSEDMRWKKWIASESLCRLAWAIYVHDASVTYLCNKRPCVSLATLYRMSLPSSKELWEAESAQSWSSLHPWSRSAPQRVSFGSVMGNLGCAREIKDSQHQYILILTYTRMLWSMKEITAAPMVSMNNNRLRVYEGEKDALIQALDQALITCGIFDARLRETPDLLRSAMRNAQIIHMCHLHAAGHFMDWLHPIIRGGANSKRAHHSLVLWANKNPKKVREVAYHSAQVMAITRRYQGNLSLEPLNAFHAGIALWCVAGLLMQKRLSVPRSTRNVRLDALPSEWSVESCQASESRNRALFKDVHSWIQGDALYESAILSIHGVPDIVSMEGRKLVLLQVAETLRCNKVWGIAQSFLAVVRQLISAEESRN